jgi:sulfite exporter TauE/SafE
MIELPLIFVAGVLGSSHCLGMCGPFALALGSASPGWTANLRRQTLYSLGRLFTYATLGSLAGFAGQRLQQQVTFLTNVSALLAIVAGAFLVYQGLLAGGLLGRRVTAGQVPCLSSGLLIIWLRSPHWQDAFYAGLFTGLIPCGLVYGFLALAASTGHIAPAALVMLAFGLGTVPLMVMAGYSGSVLNVTLRRHMWRVAAGCVTVTGLITIARGLGSLALSAGHVHCPFCP